MFQEFFEIIRNVICFSLVSFVILELAPKEEYKKYFNLFAGMVLIIMVFVPLEQLFHMQKGVDGFSDVMKKLLVQNEIKDYDRYFKDYDQRYLEEVAAGYRDEVIQNITAIIEEEQLVVNDIQIQLDMNTESENFLQLQSVRAHVSAKYQEESLKIREIVLEKSESAESLAEINIKNKISQFYNVKKDNINIIK